MLVGNLLSECLPACIIKASKPVDLFNENHITEFKVQPYEIVRQVRFFEQLSRVKETRVLITFSVDASSHASLTIFRVNKLCNQINVNLADKTANLFTLNHMVRFLSTLPFHWTSNPVTSAGVQTASNSDVMTAEKLRVTFAMDCCDREP